MASILAASTSTPDVTMMRILQSSRSRAMQLLTGVALSSVALIVTGCSSDTALSATDPRAIWTLKAAPHAVVVAVGETQPVTLSATDRDGNPVSGTTYKFQALDKSVTIDSTGVITGVTPTFAPVQIAVTGTLGNTTQRDTVVVVVTAMRQSVAHVSVQPLPGDSTRLAMFSTSFVQPVVTDSAGNQVFGVFVNLYFTPADNHVFIDPTFGFLFPLAPGKYWLHADATVYGVPLSDSVQYTFLYRAAMNFYVRSNADSSLSISSDIGNHHQFNLQTGATVTFTNQTTEPIDIHFSNASTVVGVSPSDGTGDIVGLAEGASVNRKFTAPAHYTWSLTAGAKTDSGAFDIGDPP